MVDDCFVWASDDGLIIDFTLPFDLGAIVAAPTVLAVECMLKAFEWYWYWFWCDSDEFDGVSIDEYILQLETVGEALVKQKILNFMLKTVSPTVCFKFPCSENFEKQNC